MTAIASQDKSTSRRRLLESKHVIQTPKKRISFSQRLSIFRGIFNIKRIFKHRFFSSKKRVVVSAIVLFLILLGVSAAVAYEYVVQNNPAVVYTRKVQSLTDQVRKYVSLPTDEQPVIATVTDTAKLPKEEFFSYAQDGDKILMYKKDKKAILFRPSTGKVITEATLDYQNTMPKPTPPASQTAVAGASTSAQPTVSIGINPLQSTPTPQPYHPQGKILVMPQQ